ncbi:MAG TPA: hypothetical protein VGN82_11370 [Bosea sp. (in: a-proteobacteria)]|uniref:hypothetical protein n=1 Tax=Bosea sp. (in: a-proteobacteria) TaxID=1871050 RepID=UPI002E12D5DB|nr:hypothetical protein [Bosea sp. (in: a-proteobacteria)]
MRTTIEHGAHPGENDRIRIRIETIEDYELATQKIAALDKATRGEAEQRERDALIEAVQRWDRKHDDATDWKD